MKKQRIIHAGSAVLQVVAVLIACHFLPPYLKQNPGVQMLVVVFVLTDLAHFVFHGR